MADANSAELPPGLGQAAAPGPPPARPAARLAGIDHETCDRLFRLAYRLLWNRDDADEAVQSALAVAVERRAELRDEARSWSWLCSIVVQRCRLLRRRASRWRFHWRAYAFERREEAAHATELESTDAIRNLLPNLPRRQYEVLVLRELQGMSFDQIGEVLGISASTARVHAQAAREGLRELVLRQCSEMLDGDEVRGA